MRLAVLLSALLAVLVSAQDNKYPAASFPYQPFPYVPANARNLPLAFATSYSSTATSTSFVSTATCLTSTTACPAPGRRRRSIEDEEIAPSNVEAVEITPVADIESVREARKAEPQYFAAAPYYQYPAYGVQPTFDPAYHHYQGYYPYQQYQAADYNRFFFPSLFSTITITLPGGVTTTTLYTVSTTSSSTSCIPTTNTLALCPASGK